MTSVTNTIRSLFDNSLSNHYPKNEEGQVKVILSYSERKIPKSNPLYQRGTNVNKLC